jgi:pimeloyl-ACP methyl ester carboxylesterase
MRRVTPKVFVTVVAVLTGTYICAALGNNETTAREIAMEEFMIPAADPGIQLYVRNKHPQGSSAFPAERIVLFVHGATYPSETSFDLRLNGISWMDYLAAHGYDVYLVDLRGYGKSTRPAEMAQPAEQNQPIVRTETAVKDVRSAVEFIRERRHVDKINLMGWSWGTTIMGWFTAQNNAKVNKLVLYSPMWVSNAPSLIDTGKPLGAYRSVGMPAAKSRWLTGVAEEKKADLVPAGWFEAFAAASLASDPVGSAQDPPVLRAPNGVIQDNREFWTAGKPLYDPADIRVPTFLAHAEWDQELPSYMLYAYFAKLTNAPYKSYIEIGEGTHFVMMEKNRMELFRAVQAFLDDRHRPGE